MAAKSADRIHAAGQGVQGRRNEATCTTMPGVYVSGGLVAYSPARRVPPKKNVNLYPLKQSSMMRVFESALV